jgi:iron complex outermembrane recepter protein
MSDRAPLGARWWLPVLLATIAALPCSTPARAAASATPDTTLYTLPFETLVSATRQQIPLRRSPTATTVLGTAQLSRMTRSVAADEALRFVPGVRVDNQWNGAIVHLSIRGQGILTESGVRGIKFLLDGLPLNDPSGVAPDLTDVEWGLVDRVEVLRGPAGALYGGGGSGGVVNLTTVDGDGTPFGGRVSVTGGSYGLWKELTQAGGTQGDVNWSLGYSNTRGDGYRVHSAATGVNAYEKVRWTPSDRVQVTQITSWSDHADENPEGLNLAQFHDDPRQPNPDALTFNEFFVNDRLTTGLVGRFTLPHGQELQATANYRVTHFRKAVPRFVQHRTLLTPGASLQYGLHSPFAGGVNHLTVGADAQWQGIDEYSLKNLGGATEDSLLANDAVSQRGLGVFVLDRVELGEQWSVQAGVRYDDLHNRLDDRLGGAAADLSGSADFHQATGRVGVSYAPRERLSLYADWGQGFLPPATEELSSNPDAIGGFNTHMEPATSQGGELGARGTLGARVAYDVAAFLLDTDRDFDRYRLPARPLETFYRNLGASRRYGLETQVRVRPERHVRSEVAYTYSHFRYTDPVALDGHGLPNSPDHKLDVDLEVTPASGLTLGAQVETQSRWWVDTANSTRTSGFTLWGARAAYTFPLAGRPWTAQVTGRNLTDQHYLAFTEPDPDGNSYQPGPLHEVFGTLSVRF